MKQLHWDPTAIWRVGFDQIKTRVPDSTRMIDLHRWLESFGCEFHWDCREKRLRIVPRGDHEKSNTRNRSVRA